MIAILHTLIYSGFKLTILAAIALPALLTVGIKAGSRGLRLIGSDFTQADFTRRQLIGHPDYQWLT